MEAIISPLRQDIIEAFTATGPCPIKRIALELGKSADSIYYHVRKLLDVGLLRHIETRRTKRRDEAIYDVPSDKLELSYNLDDPSIADAMRRIAASMLRRASKYFDAATELESVEPTGPERNFRVMSGMAWLTKKDLREVNRHFNAIIELTGKPRSREADQLCAITGVISPVEPQPVRRGEGG